MWIVGDIGGTNTRLAWADAGGLRTSSLRRYTNSEFPRFEDLLERFLAEASGQPQAICLAVAGPVSPVQARLTNRDWTITPAALGARFGAGRVVLLNDLAALGHAVARLPDDTSPRIDPGADAAGGGAQGLVIGIGTGLNACVFRRGQAEIAGPGPEARRVEVLEAEAGHAALPAKVLADLCAGLPPGAAPTAAAAPSCEALLAGSGLVRLARLIAGAGPEAAEGWVRSATGDGREVLAQADAGVPDAVRAVTLFGTLMGGLTREFALLYLPRGGIWMAGSVANGVLAAPQARAAFLAAFARPVAAVAGLAQQVPLRMITEDAAALEGCRLVLAEDPALA